MTVDQVYSLMKYICAKNLQQGYLAPEDFNLVIEQAQVSFMDYLLGEFQEYQVGRPVARVDYSMNEKARQRLTPFIGTPVPLTIDGTGLAAYPADYQQLDAMYDSNMNRIRYVQQHKLYSYLNSQIDPVATNPIYLIQSNGFQFYPITLGTAKLSYVKSPPSIIWGYLPDANGLPVYNPATSTDPAWYDLDMMEIISRALKFVGVSMEAPGVLQLANEIEKTGQ